MKNKRFISFLTAVAMVIGFLGYVPINNVQAATHTAEQTKTDYFNKSYTLTGDEAEDIVRVAIQQEGKTQSQLHYTVDWCALFITDCAKLAGISTNIIVPNQWAGDLGSSKTTGNFGGPYYPNNGSFEPKKGDIVYYDGVEVNGSSGHVEIVIDYNKLSNTITSIGGNTGYSATGTYCVYRHKNQSLKKSGSFMDVIGFERPNYDNVPVNPPANDDELGIPYPRPQVSSTCWIGEGSVTSGDDVRWVQYALNLANNAGLAVDGVWGTNSKNATIAFQKKYGLTADGQAGTNTINKLVELLKPSIVPTGNEMSKGAGQTIADGDYWIESALSKRYLVDIKGDNYDTTNGTNLKMHIWNSDIFGKYDVFTFKYLNNGFYQITQRTTNMSIDVNGASKERGANVQMWKSSNSTAQQWSITKTSDGYKLQAKCSGFCLDVYGGNVENNSNLNVWEDNGTKAQRFNLIPYKCSHTFGSWSTVQNATCTADGKQTRKCTDCGYSESKTIAKIGHSLSSWEITSNPTCTKTGTRQRDCSKCGYGEGESIPALSHSYGNWTNSVKTSCTVDGKDTRKCSRCGNTETRVITKTGHKYVDKVVAPTCTEKGYTLHTCSLCNDNYKDKETNITGHNFTSKMISGYMTYVCSDCGYMYTAPFEGEGTAESPFIISNADELRAVSETVNNTELNQIFGHAYYKQTTDIDLENISWTPIGLGYDGDNGTGEYNCNTRMFFGVYDGNQHTIYNLNSGKYTATGLFGCVRGENAEVINLVVFGNINSNCDGGGITGGLHYGAKITNCAFIGNVNGTAAKGSVGGISGYTNGGATISNCYHNGEITGGNETAGIVGNVAFNKWADNNAATVVENCYHVNSNVSGVKSGAIVGNCTYYEEKNNTITIKNCYASKSSNYGERNEAATYDDTMLLPDSFLKKIAEDLGEEYTDNTNPELNNGFPVFPWQLDTMLKGDADNNGVVDVNDAIMLRNWLHGSGELINWENVDLCKDSRIDVFDFCLLKRLLIENAE